MSSGPPIGLFGVASSGEGAGTALILVVTAPITRADIPGLCARLRGLLDASDSVRVICDMAEFSHPDAVAIDALGRLQLAVRRRGKSIELRNASAELRDLLGLVGLADVFLYA
jgi:ABC-type transporter Mla MlaB component